MAKIPKNAARATNGKPSAKTPTKPVKHAPIKAKDTKPDATKVVARKPLVVTKAAKPAPMLKLTKPLPSSSKAVAVKSPTKTTLTQPLATKPLTSKPLATKALATKPLAAGAPKAKNATASQPAVAVKAKSNHHDSHDPAVPRFPQNAPVPLAPVPTDGKPKKNQAGLGARELEHYRELLLSKRRELVGDMSAMEREALRSANGTNLSNLPLHMADQGTDNYEQEFTLGLVEKDRTLLRELNRALAKIQDGSYGICEGTAKPISKPRLEAQPWARFSIEYARMKERGLIRR